MSTKIKEKLSTHTQPCKSFDTPDPFIDRVYIRNLKTQKLLSEQIATYTLFVPQVMNYHRLMENKDPGWVTKKNLNEDCNTWVGDLKNTAVPRLLDRFNSLMQPICSYNDPKCLFVDSVLKVSWEPDDFMDIGHFSRKGGEKFADIISQIILSKAKEGKLYDHAR